MSWLLLVISVEPAVFCIKLVNPHYSPSFMISYHKTQPALLLLLTCLVFYSAKAQSILERTDTTITKIVYPQQDLKLWYGSDDFRVNHFVMLPNHTLLYNNDLSTFRLLSNKEMLVEDNYELATIKSILPCNADSKSKYLG